MENFDILGSLIEEGDIDKVTLFTERNNLTHEQYAAEVSKLGPNPDNTCPLVKTYPVVAAAIHGRVDILRYLISVGFDKNQFQIGASCSMNKRLFLQYGHEYGSLPIHFACREGHLDVVKCLIEEYAVDVDVMFKTRETPLYTAIIGMHLDIVKYLISKGACIGKDEAKLALPTPLHMAVIIGHVPLIQYLLSKDVDVDATDNDFWTPLVFAARYCDDDVVGFLLEGGASPDGDSRSEVTPLLNAVCSKKVENVRSLVLAGASNETHWSMKITYLDTAITMNHYEMVHCLALEMNVRINRPSKQRKAKKSLDFAMYQQNLPLIQLLLSVDYSSRRSDHVFRFKHPKKQKLISDILLTYNEMISQPKSLLQICCFRIRRAMGGRLPHDVGYLPLPKGLIEGVKLSDVPKHPNDWGSRSRH